MNICDELLAIFDDWENPSDHFHFHVCDEHEFVAQLLRTTLDQYGFDSGSVHVITIGSPYSQVAFVSCSKRGASQTMVVVTHCDGFTFNMAPQQDEGLRRDTARELLSNCRDMKQDILGG